MLIPNPVETSASPASPTRTSVRRSFLSFGFPTSGSSGGAAVDPALRRRGRGGVRGIRAAGSRLRAGAPAAAPRAPGRGGGRGGGGGGGAARPGAGGSPG